MALRDAIRNPDGSLTFVGGDGASFTSASTPAAEDAFARFQPRRQASAPLAVNDGGGGAPASDGGSGGATGGVALGSYDRPLSQPEPVVADVGPSMADQGAQGASSGGSPPPAPVAVAPAEAAPAAPAAVAPGSVHFAGGGPAGPTAPAQGAPNYASAAADFAARLAMRPSGGGGIVKGGTFETGRTTKEKTEGGKPLERIDAMADRMTAQRFADEDLAKAEAKYQEDVDAGMEFTRWVQRGLDDQHQEAKRRALNGLEERRDLLSQEIAESKIDPDKFWSDRTTGDRIGYILAAAITGGLNGFAGIKGNQVIETVNKRIDEDIRAQIHSLDAKKGQVTELGRIYQQAKEHWGDETIARNVAKQAALAAAEKKVRADASGLKDDVAFARAQKTIADLAAEREKLHFDNVGTVTSEMDKTYKTTQDRAAGGGISDKERLALLGQAAGFQAKAQEYDAGPDQSKAPQTAVFGGETHQMKGISAQEGEHIRTKLATVDVLKRDLAEVRKLREDSVAEKLMPSSYQKDVVGRISENFSTLKGMGVVRESDVARTMDALTSVRSGSESLKSAESFLHTTGQAILKQAGSRPIGPAK